MRQTASIVLLLVAVMAAATTPSAIARTTAQNPSAESPDVADSDAGVRIAEAISSSVVRVEMTLQYDRGEEPYGGGWRERCPSCGRYHVSTSDKVVAEERPVEVAGWVLGPRTVLTSDPLMHSRFIKDISVRGSDGTLIKATPAWYALMGSMMALELASPLADAKPLTFDPKRSAPYFSVSYSQGNGTWLVGVQPLPTSLAIGEDGRKYLGVAPGTLVVDREGRAVGLAVNEELPIDGSWKGSPADWPRVTDADLKKSMASFEASAAQALPRVALRFRSPKTTDRYSPYEYMREDSVVTEWNGSGILLDDRRVLVLANIKPGVTARLEQITVYGADGQPHAGTFQSTLRDYGAFIATLEPPMSGAAPLSQADIRESRFRLLLGAQVNVNGTQRIAYHTHDRIPGFDIGWKRRIYPVPGGVQQFLFSTDGALLAIPMQRREKVTVEERWSSEGETLIAACDVAATLADLDANIDPTNVPLTVEEENRIAWMGVELQPLDPELARANNVSEQTQDGMTGALVTWVYPGSPAESADLKVGDILLRLHVEGHPKPLDIAADYEDPFGAMGFPWDRLDELPEEYYSEIPSPWPSADNSLNRKLTQLGFDTAYTAEAIRDGQPLELTLTVVQSPPHYDSAPKFKHEALGVTVRDMTYEVERYLQRAPEDPGVIVSMIEPGSRASTAGLKPFELITHINDQPVMTAADFERMTTGNEELRLSVKRMSRGRIVKIDPDAVLAEPEADEGDADVEDEIEEAAPIGAGNDDDRR